MRDQILIVASNHDIAALLVALLRGHGCRATSAASGHEALALLRQMTPALVFVDAPLPDMLTQEFVTQLRARALAPMVLMSTRDDGAAMAQRLAADAFVAKPFDLEDVLVCLGLIARPAEREEALPAGHKQAAAREVGALTPA